MSEYNTKITYYYCGRLNLKKTARAYVKFYACQYGKIIVSTIKTRIYDERTNRVSSAAH